MEIRNISSNKNNNMKKLNFAGLLSLIFAAFLVSSCDELDCPRATGDQLNKTFDLIDFDELEFELGCEVIITQADDYSIEISGREEIVSDIEVRKSGDKLSFTMEECYDNVDETIITISMPDLEKIESQGSSNIQSGNLWELDNLDIAVIGSADMDLSLELDYLEVKITGSGDLKFGGIATEVDYEIEGSGDIEAFELDTEDADVKVTGSGDIELTASETLKIDIDGSGDVYYRGQPELDVSIDGSGDVINAN